MPKIRPENWNLSQISMDIFNTCNEVIDKCKFQFFHQKAIILNPKLLLISVVHSSGTKDADFFMSNGSLKRERFLNIYKV